MRAAVVRSYTMQVDVKLLRSLSPHRSAKRNAQKYFDELVAQKFVRRVESGAYLIAPELWAFPEDAPKTD
jgi:hypothetical protein